MNIASTVACMPEVENIVILPFQFDQVNTYKSSIEIQEIFQLELRKYLIAEDNFD